jgi:hypothetical protein
LRLEHPHGQQTSLLTAEDLTGADLLDTEAVWGCVFPFEFSY